MFRTPAAASRCDFANRPGLPVRRLTAIAREGLGIAAGTLRDRVARHPEPLDSLLARRVRISFERLGPTFVKAGQLLSSSPGSLPKAWIDELAICKDHVPAAPWESVRGLLEQELGDRMDRLVRVDPLPLAAGSMAQVHAAWLDDGTEVVVKVQRPGLGRTLGDDVRALRLAARAAARLSRACAAADPVGLVDRFAADLSEQLSFRKEAMNAERMRFCLVGLPVRVPRVHASLSTDRVLVMERLDGHAVDDAAGLVSRGIDPARVMRTVVSALVVPAMRQGTFHADMHSGNMVVLADGSLGLVDYGVIGCLDPSTRALTCDLLDAVVNRRFGDVARALLSIVGTDRVDLAAVIPDVQSLIGGHLETSVSELDVRATVGGVLQLAVKHRFCLPAPIVSFCKQLLYIDGVCRALDPEFDVLAGAAPIVETGRAAA